MEDRIKRFFECLIPVTICNIRCSYCYVIQRNNRKMEQPKLKYTPEQIGKALTQKRLGGTCYFSICGAGETLVPHETIEIAKAILDNGHYINITTNGTLTNRFEEIVHFPQEWLERVHFSFSFHYVELKKRNLLDTFFKNVDKVKKAGASFIVQINLCDEYLPYLDEIKRLCIEHTGAMPQVAATRKEIQLNNNVQLLTEMTTEEYISLGKTFESPLFDMTMKNFNVKRKEFCYAGDWTGTLDLSTGILSRCYGSCYRQDIFADPDRPIDFQAIGNACSSLYCMNSSHFMSLGVIPEVDTPTYASLRNREEAGWYTPRMQAFLSQKLSDNNELYDEKKEKRSKRYARKEVVVRTLSKWKHNAVKQIKRLSGDK